MKRPVLLVCILIGTLLGQSRQPSDPPIVATPPYFPAGVFETSAQSFRDNWYSCTLRALQEPSLFALRSDSSLQVYRFLWLPSFHRPISIRLTINADGSGSVVTRSVDFHAGLLTKPTSDTGKLVLDTTSTLEKSEVQVVLDQLQRIVFWSMRTEEGQAIAQSETVNGKAPLVPLPPVDGSQWILEGVRGGEYHVVDRWSPKDNSYSQLCKYLLRLGRVEANLY